MRVFIIIIVSLLLGSCASSREYPTNNLIEILGEIEQPPHPNQFVGAYRTPRTAIEAYHTAMQNYVQYLLTRQRKIELTYNIDYNQLGRPCYHREVKLPELPPIPNVSNLPDTKVVDVLIDHIQLLRAKLEWTAQRNIDHNEDSQEDLLGCVVVKY